MEDPERSSVRLVTLADLFHDTNKEFHITLLLAGLHCAELRAVTDLFRAGDFPTSSCSVVSLEERPLF